MIKEILSILLLTSLMTFPLSFFLYIGTPVVAMCYFVISWVVSIGSIFLVVLDKWEDGSIKEFIVAPITRLNRYLGLDKVYKFIYTETVSNPIMSSLIVIGVLFNIGINLIDIQVDPTTAAVITITMTTTAVITNLFTRINRKPSKEYTDTRKLLLLEVISLQAISQVLRKIEEIKSNPNLNEAAKRQQIKGTCLTVKRSTDSMATVLQPFGEQYELHR